MFTDQDQSELLALLEAERQHALRREMLDELMDSYGIAPTTEQRAAEHREHEQSRVKAEAIRIENRKANPDYSEPSCDLDQERRFLREWYTDVALDLWENTCVAATYLAALKGERCPSTHDYMALFPHPGATTAHELRGRMLKPKAGTRREAHEFYYAYLKRVGFSTFHSEIRLVMHRAPAAVIAERIAEMEVEFARAKAELAAAHREPDSESSGGEAK